MIDCLSAYIEEWEKDLNIPLMTKSEDSDLVEYVADAWESLQVVKYIQFLGYDLETRESNIDINHHIFRRQKKIPKRDQRKLKMIDDTRCHLFTAHVKISLEEMDPKTGRPILREKIIHKDMLIPVADEDGMYYINGKKYYIIYQLTEKSTYNTLDSNVLKSLMPTIVKRESIQKEDTSGTLHTLPVYSTFVYRRKAPILLYMFANSGVAAGLIDLRVDSILRLVDEDRKDPDCLYFAISSRCYIEVNKELFHSYSYVKSIVGGLYETLSNRFDLSMMEDSEMFIKKLTPSNTVEKGMDNLTSFNRMMDKTTQKVLQLDMFHKEDVYAVLRWMMFEFDELRMKDNMDLKNKRLRCNEYVASLLTHEFSNKLNRVINLGNKVTLDQIVDIFKFPGDRRTKHNVAAKPL